MDSSTTEPHLAVAENTDVHSTPDSEKDSIEDTDVTPLRAAEEDEAGNHDNQTTEPDAEALPEKHSMGEAGEEVDEGTIVPVTFSSNNADLPGMAESRLSSSFPPPAVSSSKPSRSNRRRRTLRLSRKQKDAVRRHAKNASKRFLMFLVSHVGLTCLVIAYSIMGGFIFQRLEASNEVESISHIQEIRSQHVQRLWNVTVELNILEPVEWSKLADTVLSDFQKMIYQAVKDKGWDGSDNVTNVELQWTFAGSLLYSVTIITTIGYGHLTPITTLGRVATMIYALIGIPMTLLCLANIGSFMAHCFRLLWKQIVCKPCRNHIRRRSMYLAARQKASTAAYVARLAKQKRDASGRAEDGDAQDIRPSYSHCDVMVSDSPALVHDSTSLLGKPDAKKALPSGESRYILGFEDLTKGESVSSELNDQHKEPEATSKPRTPNCGYSLHASSQPPMFQYPAPVHPPPVTGPAQPNPEYAATVVTMNKYPEVTITTTVNQPDPPHPEVDPVGEAKLSKPEVVRVPIMVCLIMVTAYIFLGAVLFSLWEKWGYFESSYFCFITLSTIGFGDIVPGYDRNAWGNQAKRVSCTLYLLFGLALLAMCFELIQSECRQKFNDLARALGFTNENEQK